MSNKKKTDSTVDIKIVGFSIKKSDCIKYLGVLIHCKLKWKQHSQYVNRKILKGIGILAKMRHYVSTGVLKQVYHAFITPRIRYGIINWGSASKCATNTQNIALKGQ